MGRGWPHAIRNAHDQPAWIAGEEAATLDLLPLLMVVAQEGRIEEEMFLTTFLFEEAKHTEFFRLLLDAIGETGDLSHFHSATYRKIFYEILPEAMNRLLRAPWLQKPPPSTTCSSKECWRKLCPVLCVKRI